jgi:hypothetical protein
MQAGVGDGVGDAVGEAVGDAVGAFVGVEVGDSVGALEGAGVGTATHADCLISPAVQVPRAQSWHKWYAALSWYVPERQCSQVVCPSPLA